MKRSCKLIAVLALAASMPIARGANVKFEKTTEAKYIELRIQDSTGKLQPEFEIKLWQ